MAIQIMNQHNGEQTGMITSNHQQQEHHHQGKYHQSRKNVPQHLREELSSSLSTSSSSSSSSSSIEEQETCLNYYLISEIAKHNTEESAWIVAGDDIYDVTYYLGQHPAGTQPILKKTGGAVDCTQDMLFHSKRGQRLWQKYHIGKITTIASKNGQPIEQRPWWMFWE
jgi:cytochrome b involved in lipid metabolism